MFCTIFRLENIICSKFGIVESIDLPCLFIHIKRDHISDDLETDLHWLPVRYRIIFKILVMTFKALHNLAPGYISDLIHQHAPNRRLRSGDLMLLDVSKSKPQNLWSQGLLICCTSHLE